MKDAKEVVRKRILAERSGLSEEEVLERSIKIQERLYVTQHYQSARTVMTYVDFQNEVETRSIITRAFKEEKNVVVPVCGPNYSLWPVKIESLEDLEPGTMGVLEPSKTKTVVQKEKLDLVLMPGIAFDRHGNRLGYGLAYYDRFLAELSPSTVIIALAYDFQVLSVLPHEDHDRKVDIIITEREIIRC